MGHVVSSGGGQSSLGYLFGGGEALKPAVENAEPVRRPSPVVENAEPVRKPSPVVENAEPVRKPAPAPAPADNGKQTPAGVPVKTTNNYFRADGHCHKPLDNGGSTGGDEDREEESDSHTGSSESDTTSSSSDDDIEGDDDNTEEKDSEDVEGKTKPNVSGKRPDCTVKDDDSKHLDVEMYGFELEEVNVSSEEETEKGVKGPIKSQNELDVLPPVPPVDVVLLPHHQTLPVGVVSSIVGSRVIIDGNVKHDPLNEGSILWITESRAPLGLVDEIFGPVKNPYYIVRYNLEDGIPLEIHVGASVSFVAEFSTNIFNQSALYKKGYDASGENDRAGGGS